MAVEDSVRQLSRMGMEADPAEAAIRALWRVKADANVAGKFPRIVPKVLHYRSHLPLYSLAAAAGVFGEQQSEVGPEGWVAVPPGHIYLTQDMFVTHITGRSMEPLIPDGSLCAFRSHVSRPWDGKIVLIEDYSKVGGNRYVVKCYRASKHADPMRESDPAWLHERVTLESINPAFRPLEIPSDRKINVIGEFTFVVS